MVRVKINRATFEQLYEAIIQKIGLPTENGRSAKYFGMGDYAPNRPLGKGMETVASIMAKDIRVIRLLDDLESQGEKVAKVNYGDYLYKKDLHLKSNPELEEIEFVGKKYVYGFFNYLGYNNLEDFETHLKHSGNLDVATENASASPVDDGWTYYIGAYFSVKSFGVRSFVLAINFSKPVNNKYPAREWGFHKLGDVRGNDLESQKTDINYDGYATIVDKRWLCVQLEGHEGKNPFFLIGVVPDSVRLVKQHRIIRSILLSVSVRHYPVSAEAILIKTTSDYATKAVSLYEKLSSDLLVPDLTQEESDLLKLYIMLQRRNFYTSPDIVEDISSLQARGSSLKNFTFLSGVYRILNFGLKRGYVVQSVMVVEPHQYRATLYPYIKKDIAIKNQNMLRQSIVFNISRIRQNKLCLIAYGEPGMSVASYAIFDLETDHGKGFFEGCFISCGYDSRGIIGGYCVVQKVEVDTQAYLDLRELADKSPTEAQVYATTNHLEHLLDLNPREFSAAEMDIYARKYGLEALQNGLRAIWRKKLWKQRKVYGDDYPYRPELIKWGNRVYVLNRPLECQTNFDDGMIEIAHEMLNISVKAQKRIEAESAFAEAFHLAYESQQHGSQFAYWVRTVINLE